jgi:membrane-bound lytic murein transglycosylase D
LSEASQYLNTGLECLNDSLWFEAGDNLDSAMSRLSALENVDSLDPATSIATQALKDTVQALMLKVAAASGEVEELNPLTDVTEADVDSSENLASHAFDSLSNSLDYSLYDLPVSKPLPGRVQQALSYFNGPARKVFAKWLNRKSRYEAFVRERLEARGMPKDLFFLAMVESGLNPRAYSHARAAGMWQFIPGTGRRYGLMDDYWIDPRRDVLAATDAALSYLQSLFSEFGDWQLAMAAYNCGEGRIRRELAKDSTLDYWSMKLPAETRFYVPKILAAMIIGHEPERFGFTIDDPHPVLAFDTITVTDCLPLKDVAKAVQATEEQIQDLNPSLRRWCTPPNRKAHILYLPPGTRETFAQAYAKMDKSSLLSWKQYRVTSGDNLSIIARKFGISTPALKSANQLKSNRLHIGQTLIIPIPINGGTGEFEAEVLRATESTPKKRLEVTYRVRRGDNLFDIGRRFNLSVDKLRALNGLTKREKIYAGQILKVGNSPAALPTTHRPTSSTSTKVAGEEAKPSSNDKAALGNPQTHVVAKGETIFGLSRTFGVTQADLVRWNDLEGKDLKAGQKIVYYSKAASAGLMSASAAPLRPEQAPASVPEQYYVVKPGDTLWDISQRFQSSVEQLKHWNDGLASVLKPGTRLRVR